MLAIWLCDTIYQVKLAKHFSCNTDVCPLNQIATVHTFQTTRISFKQFPYKLVYKYRYKTTEPLKKPLQGLQPNYNEIFRKKLDSFSVKFNDGII